MNELSECHVLHPFRRHVRLKASFRKAFFFLQHVLEHFFASDRRTSITLLCLSL